MKSPRQYPDHSRKSYAAIPFAVSLCALLSACGGLGSSSFSVNTGYDYDGEDSLREIMQYQVENGDVVGVNTGIDVVEVYGAPIYVSARDVTLEGNGSNRLHYALGDILSPALSGDAQSAGNYVASGWLNANASRVAQDAQYQGITKIIDGERGIFYWSNKEGNNFSMKNIHVAGTDRTEYGDIVGGMVGAFSNSSSSARVGSMKDTLFTNVMVTAAGHYSEITGGLIGAYSASDNAEVGVIRRSLFDHIDIYTNKDTINGGAIGVEGKMSGVGNIEQSQFSNFIIDSGYRVIGGGVGAIANGNNDTARINYINNSLFNNFDVYASDFIVGGSVGMAATRHTEQTGIGNSVFASMDIRGRHITGGAVGLRSDHGNAVMGAIDSSYIGNIASDSSGDIIGGAVGLYAGGHTSGYTTASIAGMNNVVINQVYASASGNIYGGAAGLYTNVGNASIGYIQNSTFQNNATNSYGSVYGGAIGVYVNSGIAGLGTIYNSAFLGNHASSDYNAYGGAVYTTGLQNALNIHNSTFINNKASSNINAYGGAIFIDTRAANAGSAHTVNLVADNGQKTLFQGNTVHDSTGLHNNAIHFGTITGSHSAENAALNIYPAAGSEVALHDPVTVDMNNGRRFTLNMNGAGTFYWDGNNTFAAQGGSQVNLFGGSTILGNSFQLGSNSNPLQVNAGAGSRLEFMGHRDPSTPMFDFTGAPASSLSADSSVRFGVSSRQLTNVNGTFLVAKGLGSYSAFNPQNNGSVVSYDTSTPDELKVNVNYISPYRAAINRSINTVQAQYALNDLVSDTVRVADEDFDAIANNLPDATAEYGMTQALVALGTSQAVLRTVSQFAYTEPQRQRLLAEQLGYRTGQEAVQVATASPSSSALLGLGATPEAGTSTPLRVWGGYIGDFPRASSYNSYQGYKADTNGFVLGAGYDVNPRWNIGAYAAYTDGKTHLRNENTRVLTDGYHFGLTSSYALTPQLTLQADMGGAHYSNDGQRCIGNACAKSDFDQNLYTIGGGLSYLFKVQDVAIRPFGGLRYTYIKQSGFTEQGHTTASHVGGFHLNSVASNLGVSASRVFEINSKNLIAPEISLAWRHEWGDRQAGSSSYYTSVPRQSFVIGSYKSDRDFADLGLGLHSIHYLKSGNVLSTYVNYQLGLSEHTDNHSLNVGLQLQF